MLLYESRPKCQAADVKARCVLARLSLHKGQVAHAHLLFIAVSISKYGGEIDVAVSVWCWRQTAALG